MSSFHNFITAAIEKGHLLLQPRMVFSSPEQMRTGLLAVKHCGFSTVGTITIDSFTRQLKFSTAKEAVEMKKELNGYPIVSFEKNENASLIDGIFDSDFSIQVRHGCAKPIEIFKSILEMGLDATEGGPISYCMPYGREPLKASVKAWAESCQLFGENSTSTRPLHIESFGGCLLGQLCPPSMLVAITVLECMFMQANGVSSVSLSYAQGSNLEQDLGALAALQLLAEEFLQPTTWHIVMYTFMGMFPATESGAKSIIEDSTWIAKRAGIPRLIVKTASEAHGIPSIQDNVMAIEWASNAENKKCFVEESKIHWNSEIIFQQARSIVSAVLNTSSDIGSAIELSFKKGYLDIPYCLHNDNKKLASSWVDHAGSIQWAEVGKIPFPDYLKNTIYKKKKLLSSSDLLNMLSFNKFKYDFNMV
ncbi:hypothetical protein AB835_05630 [Candidatus Endobugula sertula]|uniref:Methylaspartate mutase n=1 Tax=Candidatus Endobugula sertula TaxID=62101 RepID=A0A1D2QQY9_9GAMM|nr:hypothetical protein AB835_05630 [Candidatus Endobugula sertula]